MSAFLILFSLAVGGIFLIIVGLYIESILSADAAKPNPHRLRLTRANQTRRVRYRKTRLKKLTQRETGPRKVLTNGHSRRISAKMARLSSHPSLATKRQQHMQDAYLPSVKNWRHSNSSRPSNFK